MTASSSAIPDLVAQYLSDVVAINYLLHWSQEEKSRAYSIKLDKLLGRVEYLYSAISSLCSYFEIACTLPQVPADGDPRRLRNVISEVYALVESTPLQSDQRNLQRVAHRVQSIYEGHSERGEGHPDSIDVSV